MHLLRRAVLSIRRWCNLQPAGEALGGSPHLKVCPLCLSEVREFSPGWLGCSLTDRQTDDYNSIMTIANRLKIINQVFIWIKAHWLDLFYRAQKFSCQPTLKKCCNNITIVHLNTLITLQMSSLFYCIFYVSKINGWKYCPDGSREKAFFSGWGSRAAYARILIVFRVQCPAFCSGWRQWL